MGRRTQTKKPSTALQIKLKQGTILCDAAKGEWQLGKPIAAGGFGRIYLASAELEKKVPNDALYVAKIEQLSNGPLFVEMHFYLRVAKDCLIEEWKESHKLRHLGMPMYHGFGSYVTNSEKYRFLILDRFGPDVGSIFLKNHRCLSLKTVLNLGLQILDILEFIHYYGYIHADVKGSNMLLGLGEDGLNHVYLLDYGLACMYIDRFGRHKEFNPDLRRAHDGTLEYTSRDAHVGAHSRRGDIEALGYNLVQWLAGRLPWEADLLDPERVAESKNIYMANIPLFLDQCFPNQKAPVGLEQFLKYVARLSFTGKPDYNKLRGFLRQGLKAANLPDDGKLDIASVPVKLTTDQTHSSDGSDTENHQVSRRHCPSRAGARTPCGPVQICDRRTRQQSNTGRTFTLRSREFDWVKVLQSHPERDAKPAASKRTKSRKYRPKLVEDIAECLQRPPEDPRANPTPAMLEFLEAADRSISPSADPYRRRPRPTTPAVEIRRKRPSTSSRKPSRVETPSPVSALYTPAMEEVVRRRGLSSHFEPAYTAIASRAGRVRNREQVSESISPSVSEASSDVEVLPDSSEEEEDEPVSSRTRSSVRLSVIAQRSFQPIACVGSQSSNPTLTRATRPIAMCPKTPVRPKSPTVVRAKTPTRKRSKMHVPARSKTPIPVRSNTPTPVRPKTPTLIGSLTPPPSLYAHSKAPMLPSTTEESLALHPTRLTRHQARCVPTLWKPVAYAWRPPTPPVGIPVSEESETPAPSKRKTSAPAAVPARSRSTIPWASNRKVSEPLLSSPRKRRYSEDVDFTLSSDSSRSSTPSSIDVPRRANLSKKNSRPPTQPKYRQRSLSKPKVKRACRREVSPSEIDFVPRLRSGKDTSDEYWAFHSRPASTPPGGVKLFAGNQTLMSSMGRPLRPLYRLASLL